MLFPVALVVFTVSTGKNSMCSFTWLFTLHTCVCFMFKTSIVPLRVDVISFAVHFRKWPYFKDDWLRKKVNEDSVQRGSQLLCYHQLDTDKRERCVRSKTLSHILSVFLSLIECIVRCIKNYSETSAYYSSAWTHGRERDFHKQFRRTHAACRIAASKFIISKNIKCVRVWVKWSVWL